MTHNDNWRRSHEHASYMYTSCAMYCTSILSIVYTTLENCNKICTTSPCGARPARIHWQAWGTESIFHGKHLDATSNEADFYKVKIQPQHITTGLCSRRLSNIFKTTYVDCKCLFLHLPKIWSLFLYGT